MAERTNNGIDYERLAALNKILKDIYDAHSLDFNEKKGIPYNPQPPLRETNWIARIHGQIQFPNVNKETNAS